MLVDFNVIGDMVHDLLIKSGFCEDLFIIKIEWNRVIILFDMKEAVDYFESDFNYSDMSQKYEYTYKRDGKRHSAIITKRKHL